MKTELSEPSSNSIKTIQRRLIFTLVRAFLVVVAISIIAVIGTTIYQINSNVGRNPFYKSPNATILEAYYMGHGGWGGIETLINPNNPDSRLLGLNWDRAVLLDQNGDVVLYEGRTFPGVPFSMMPMRMKSVNIPLTVRGNVIGTLIVDDANIPHPLRLTLSVLNPIFFFGLILILLTVVIGILLMRRMVNPLAEVIAAAESVAAGNLKTRIKIGGAKDDLAALGLHFNHMTETLERNDVERRAMLADTAHELRTPLSVLRGRLEGILDGVYAPNEANIAQALEETYLLERLVEDLRLLTLAESRQLHFELKETDIVDLIKKTVSVFTPQATNKSVTLSLDSNLPTVLCMVDSQRLEQVIGNLIGNSLRYVSGNGNINLTITQKQSEVEISVADTGPGVPEEELLFIFDRFWRGEKSRARVTGGAGLGLAISKQLVEAQGGKISAQNRSEGGLIVKITFPPLAK